MFHHYSNPSSIEFGSQNFKKSHEISNFKFSETRFQRGGGELNFSISNVIASCDVAEKNESKKVYQFRGKFLFF